MPPQQTPIEALFNVSPIALGAASDELFNVLVAAFEKIHKERKIDGRVSMSIVRALVAKMYTSLDATERAQSDQFARALMKKLSMLVLPGGVQQ